MEGLSKAALMKSLSPRVMLSNHLLPKGSKMKVNLEDQGRQKVSFSFPQIKKPRQNVFFVPTSPDKSVIEPQTALSQSTPDKGKTEQTQASMVPASVAETHSQAPVTSATNLKPDLAKMHFKKQILSVSATEEQLTSVMAEEEHSCELQDLQKSIIKSAVEFSTPQPHRIVSDESSESTHIKVSETRITQTLKKPATSSGKDGETSSNDEHDSKIYKSNTRSQSDSAPVCSESDGDSAQMSSSRKAADSKSKTNSESRSREVKKSSSGSHVEEKEKSFSRRSENHERSSSYSKSDRDSRHTSSRSSRSDKDRRRSRSRSRSKSRGSRTSSSHSRSERSRGDRGSRSERSYYHESDRRSHRSSPRRERRRSRSRTDRTRDSSDSEDDHRKTKTRTNDSSRSAHSCSHKESKSSSYSKSEKVSKSIGSPHSSEIDKRMQPLKSERTSKRSDSDSQRKCSPDLDSSYRRSSTNHKLENNCKSSSSSTHTHSQTYEKRQKSSSSDSEADHKGKSQASDRSSGSEEKNKNSLKRSGQPDLKQMTPSRSSVKNTEHNRQSDYIFHSQAPSCAATTELCSQSKKEKSDSHQDVKQHSTQDVKEMVSFTEKILQESSSKRTKENNSGLEVENKNTSPINSSENLKHVNATLEHLTNVKDHISSNNQPDVNLNVTVLKSCSSKDSTVHFDCSPGPTTLPDITDIPVTHAQENTKAEIDELNNVSTVDMPSNTAVPYKLDSLCLESENQLACGQQSIDCVKKSVNAAKKSRWDIVGQDSSESDISQRTLCTESTPTVKKVISVKKIELSKDNSQQDSACKDNVQEAEMHSILVKQTEISKQEVDTDKTFMTDRYKDQSELSQASTGTDHWDSRFCFSQKTSTAEHLHINNTLQVDVPAKMQSWNGNDHEERSKDSSSKSKLSKRTPLSQDLLGGQSEASDSDNSEYDSDCGEAIKRLHSVVVVPKNSSLTVETQDTGASCSPLTNSELHNADIHVNIYEAPNQVISEQIQGSSSTAFGMNSGLCAGLNESSISRMLCQSQSNMIDSTSHSEGSSGVSTLPCVAGHITASRSTIDPAHSLDNSKQGHKQHAVSSRGEQLYSRYQHDDFSSADNISDKNSFSLGWDFSQSEQPSSTYQQPDSSHGPQLPNTKMMGTSLQGQEHRQDCASWNHKSPNIQTSRKPYFHSHENCQDLVGEIHPDSLTNDHDDYSGDKPPNLSKTIANKCSGPNTLGSSSFVQGHEISSNSKGSAVPDPSREGHFRPHRGRGPPKKRRPEVESDSDNEAEAGPAGKRERQGDNDNSKETLVKADVHRPSLTLLDFQDATKWKDLSKSKKMPPYFDLIEENLYLTER